MFTSPPPNHNRLLDLDQTLLGWKQRLTLAEQDFEEIPWQEEEVAIPDHDDELLEPIDTPSYTSLAKFLESRTQEFDYSPLHHQMQSSELEAEAMTVDGLFEPFFFRNSQPEITSDLPTIQASAVFNLPDIDLPEADEPDESTNDSEAIDQASSYQALSQIIRSVKQNTLQSQID